MAIDVGQVRLEEVFHAAELYYSHARTMESIARDLGVSRSTVSRMLALARERGLVDIRLNPPSRGYEALERSLESQYAVRAHVVPISSGLREIDKLDRVAAAAAQVLNEVVDSNMTVGVAWGSTMSAVAQRLTQKRTHGTTCVQLNGAGNTRTSGVEYSAQIMQSFGAAFMAAVQYFPVPAFFDDAGTKDAMWRERSIRRVLALQSSMDMAVFSLGSPRAEVPSRVYVGGYLGRTDYESLERDDVVGDLATVFYRADGSWADVQLNARATGPRLDLFRRVPRRVCIVAGMSKLEATIAALRAGYITTIVLDEPLAARVLESGFAR